MKATKDVKTLIVGAIAKFFNPELDDRFFTSKLLSDSLNTIKQNDFLKLNYENCEKFCNSNARILLLSFRVKDIIKNSKSNDWFILHLDVKNNQIVINPYNSLGNLLKDEIRAFTPPIEKPLVKITNAYFRIVLPEQIEKIAW